MKTIRINDDTHAMLTELREILSEQLTAEGFPELAHDRDVIHKALHDKLKQLVGTDDATRAITHARQDLNSLKSRTEVRSTRPSVASPDPALASNLPAQASGSSSGSFPQTGDLRDLVGAGGRGEGVGGGKGKGEAHISREVTDALDFISDPIPERDAAEREAQSLEDLEEIMKTSTEVILDAEGLDAEVLIEDHLNFDDPKPETAIASSSGASADKEPSCDEKAADGDPRASADISQEELARRVGKIAHRWQVAISEARRIVMLVAAEIKNDEDLQVTRIMHTASMVCLELAEPDMALKEIRRAADWLRSKGKVRKNGHRYLLSWARKSETRSLPAKQDRPKKNRTVQYGMHPRVYKNMSPEALAWLGVDRNGNPVEKES